MSKQLVLILLLGISVMSFGQPDKPSSNKPPATNRQPVKKYPSLLWEITGNGLKKPSYLFGTMHVSDKLAFHLGDSFYNALRSVQVVALETNPEHWQDDYSKSAFYGRGLDEMSYGFYQYLSLPADKMSIGSFAIDDYAEAIKAALAVEPSMINGFLYRTYGTSLDDFEEDTYLDMYIFQAGKKLGKRLTGVENFEESEKLVMEAYRDMMKDRNRKRRSYDFDSWITNPKKVEDAYRKGDLDVLDSLQALTVTSEAFEEKFLYKRNDIQAYSIDTIIKKNQTLFAAVGAAHLPGKRGIIEILRRMGYTVRPVQMDDRNSTQKETIDKSRFGTRFYSQTSDDEFFSVSIPGKKFYRFTDWGGMDVVQYADMVNGAYYMVTRIKTNSLSWGHSQDLVHKKIDSFMYENVPGKILRKFPITKNGYKGWEIQNRTRRGDHQRYNIFVTPFEIVIFKMSGNGEYITKGMEAQQFFSSIKLREYKPGEWIRFAPKTGGFTVQLPHQPSAIKNEHFGANRLEYSAMDKNKGNSYMIMQSNLHNYSYAEEDTFELNLMNDSYGFSSFIDKELEHRFSKQNGYPAMEAVYQHKDGSYSKAKYVIRGPLYYVIIPNYKKENDGVRQFFNSFNISPFIYPEIKTYTDTTLHFTVQSPVFRDTAKTSEMDNYMSMMRMYMSEEEEGEDRYKTLFVGNDTVGEKIFVTYTAPKKYSFQKDSSKLWQEIFGDDFDEDSSFIYKLDKKYTMENGIQCRDIHLTDTGSSRLIMTRWLYKDGHFFSISTLTDTLSKPSPFLQSFFATFRPADTLKGQSLFARKTEQFFKDFFSTDSATAKKARLSLYEIEFDSLDVGLLKTAIERLNWNTRSYLNTKQYFISELGLLKDPSVVPYLKELYVKAKDTSALQNTILNALLRKKTKESFVAFKDLILQEPPLSDDDYRYDGHITPRIRFNNSFLDSRWSLDDEEFVFYGPWSPLYDTLQLTKLIFPELLPLMNVDDYESEVMDLLTHLVDSGYAKAPDYEAHFSKLYIDAKQLLKKQNASEDKEKIYKIERKERNSMNDYSWYEDEDDEDEIDQGNGILEQYAKLLMPFYDKNPGVATFFDQLLKTRDRQLLYDVFILMLRNNRPVHDSLFIKYARLDEYRVDLYKDLKKIRKLEKFPAAYKTQEFITRSLLEEEGYYYNKPDTVIFVNKLPVEYKNKKGYVYFYKFKEERDDNHWQLAAIGMQPFNQDSVAVGNQDFTSSEGRRIENDKPVEEQMQKMLKELLYAQRESASEFYDSRGYNFYKTYLPDLVKRRRYRD